MSKPAFQCPCCGQETAVAFTIEEVAERFSGSTRDLIDLLSSGRWKSRDQLFNALYGHRSDGGPESLNVISVRMNHLSKTLRPYGYEVSRQVPGADRRILVYRLSPIAQAVSS